MFYQKTDAEIFCETLLKLVEKQEKFLERHFGKPKEQSPFEDAIKIMLKKVEVELGLPSGERVNHEITIPKRTFISSEEISKVVAEKTVEEKRGRGRPPGKYGHYFNGKKPKIQVIHGAPDDSRPQEEKPADPAPKEPAQDNINTSNVEPQKVDTSPLPEITETLTPDNAEELISQISGVFDGPHTPNEAVKITP